MLNSFVPLGSRSSVIPLECYGNVVSINLAAGWSLSRKGPKGWKGRLRTLVINFANAQPLSLAWEGSFSLGGDHVSLHLTLPLGEMWGRGPDDHRVATMPQRRQANRVFEFQLWLLASHVTLGVSYLTSLSSFVK